MPSLEFAAPLPMPTPFARPQTGDYEVRPARTRSHLKGVLVYGNGVFTLDCVVHDISTGGAKIILSEDHALPSDLYLIVVSRSTVHKAAVVWQRFPTRGLKFSETYALNDPLPESVQFLRRLWIDLCARPTSL